MTANKLWNMSCPDYWERIQKGEPPFDFDKFRGKHNKQRADKAVAIFDRLVLPDVPGQPRLEGACGEWFREIVRLLAGGLDKKGAARVRQLLLAVPKKNSKTTFGGALMLTLMLISPRPRAEFVLVGPTHEIALLAFNQIAGMIYADEYLREILHVREHLKTIESRESACRLAIKSFDVKISTGSKPAAVLLDEAHLLTHPDAPRVIGQLRGGQGPMPEALFIMITTASDIPAQGFWKSELSKARKVRDGQIDLPGYASILYEPPQELMRNEKAVEDPKLWALLNPNLNRSVTLDWLESSYAEAKAAGRHEQLRWLSQHANIEVSSYSLGDDQWGGSYLWSRGARDDWDFDDLLASAEQVSIGIDGGGMDDMLAMVYLFVLPGDVWFFYCHCWLAEVAIERRQSNASLYYDFQDQGDLTIGIPGDDLQDIAEMIKEVDEAGKLAGIGIDPAGIASEIAQVIDDAGIGSPTGEESAVIAVPQGFKLNPAYQMMQRRLVDGRLRHANQPVLNWCVSNAKRADSGLVTKKASGVGKIDALVACAVAVMIQSQAPEPFSVEAFMPGFVQL